MVQNSHAGSKFFKEQILEKKWVLKRNDNTSPFTKEAGQSASQAFVWWFDEFFVFVFHTCIEISGLKF